MRDMESLLVRTLSLYAGMPLSLRDVGEIDLHRVSDENLPLLLISIYWFADLGFLGRLGKVFKGRLFRLQQWNCWCGWVS
jgi:hypothetical protein